MAQSQSAKIEEIIYLESIRHSTLPLAEKLTKSDNPEAIYLGLQLEESVSNENLFVGFGMYNQNGEIFNGRGSLVVTSSRLDRFYLKATARRNRKTIEQAVKDLLLERNERWRFITLTMPKLCGCNFALTADVFSYAFKKLRDSALWKQKVRVGVKSLEFTLGDKWKRENRNWTFDDGFHFHAHLMAISKWIENRKQDKDGNLLYRELAEQWKKCLLKSAKKFNVKMNFNTDDALPIVDVRLITNKAKNNEEISLKKAIDETAKYITKTSDLSQLPTDQLLEVQMFLKGKRMIEPLGELNARKGKIKPKETLLKTDLIIETTHTAPADTSVLYTQTIESFSREKSEAIALIKKGKIAEARAKINHAFEKRRIFRRRQLCFAYPTAEFITLTGEIFTLDDYSPSDLREKIRE